MQSSIVRDPVGGRPCHHSSKVPYSYTLRREGFHEDSTKYILGKHLIPSKCRGSRSLCVLICNHLGPLQVVLHVFQDP